MIVSLYVSFVGALLMYVLAS